MMGRTTPAPPVRHVHLGLGNFFRAHQAWYTQHAPDAGEWGIAAFTGRSPRLAETLTAQDGRYTLVVREPGGDRFEPIDSVVAAHAASDHAAWLGYLADPAVALVTTTVTEAGYLRGPAGGVDAEAVAADVAALRADPRAPVATAPGRLVAGFLARRAADAGPLTLVPCDNLPENGTVLAEVVGATAELVDPTLAAWIEANVGFVTTMVDRITPATTPEVVALVATATGTEDRAPVVTEPFSEWVLAGEFRGPRPRWEEAGATFVDDVAPHERRKLFLLNGAHSLLAYAGSAAGHETVAEAMADPAVRSWVESWWDEATAHLELPRPVLDAYRTALVARFANPAIRHLLAQIAADGSQKLPVRILPTLRAERTAGRMPVGAVRALAGWTAHLRGHGAPVTDARPGVREAAEGPLPDAVRAVLALLDPALVEDRELVAAVTAAAGDWEA